MSNLSFPITFNQLQTLQDIDITTTIQAQLNSISAGIVIADNPTATIGLSAVNGSALTYLRSDGAPALSQSIAPTWSGLHTFSIFPVTPSSSPTTSYQVSNKKYVDDSIGQIPNQFLLMGG